ncbi:putative glycoside hydrolase family 88 protein [Diaporthe ampelina]|uniref:Putative glycoside hydrolase family 88 protein n=1 Tax=Diaporthe ampelina TaxID=1214573 RepID=A0A0G2FN43_9PEZI|nr:putative glycoside hydrolase family 88 protein [Diaporthe ampelina]
MDAGREEPTAVLSELYSPSVTAKLWSVAQQTLQLSAGPPTLFPEYTHPGDSKYVYRDLKFWTSGFFPGSLYLLLERQARYAQVFQHKQQPSPLHRLQLEHACTWWTENLHANAHLAATHDLGFMIMPWARPAWELRRDARALETLKNAAATLHGRYSPAVGAIRSWDSCVTRAYSFQDPSREFLLIIDNMMNLSLLFYVAAHTGDAEMREAAVTHARTTRRTHVRADGTTSHLVVLDPGSGAVRQRLTNQGRHHESCWSRGQAWAVAGFAEAWGWTREEEFLDTAVLCADVFLERMPQGDGAVPPWDFEPAPAGAEEQGGGAGEGIKTSKEAEPTDTSAAMIASYGFLLIYEALRLRESAHAQKYLDAALRITSAVCRGYLTARARFVSRANGATVRSIVDTPDHGAEEQDVEVVGFDVDDGGYEAILDGATINNYEFAPRRWANHSLVYADYYFMQVGNKLLEMGIGHAFVGQGA